MLSSRPSLKQCLALLQVHETPSDVQTARLCFNAYRELSWRVHPVVSHQNDAGTYFTELTKALFYAVRELLRRNRHRRSEPEGEREYREMMSLAPSEDSDSAFLLFYDSAFLNDAARSTLKQKNLEEAQLMPDGLVGYDTGSTMGMSLVPGLTAPSASDEHHCPCCGLRNAPAPEPMDSSRALETQAELQAQVEQFVEETAVEPTPAPAPTPAATTAAPQAAPKKNPKGTSRTKERLRNKLQQRKEEQKLQKEPETKLKESVVTEDFDPCPRMETPELVPQECAVEVTWSRPSTRIDVTLYEVELAASRTPCEVGAPGKTRHVVYKGQALKYTVPNLLAQWHVFVRVRCQTFAGTGEWSDWIECVTRGEPRKSDAELEEHPSIADNLQLQKQKKRDKRKRKKERLRNERTAEESEHKAQQQRQLEQQKLEAEKRQKEEERQKKVEEEAYERMLAERKKKLASAVEAKTSAAVKQTAPASAEGTATTEEKKKRRRRRKKNAAATQQPPTATILKAVAPKTPTKGKASKSRVSATSAVGSSATTSATTSVPTSASVSTSTASSATTTPRHRARRTPPVHALPESFLPPLTPPTSAPTIASNLVPSIATPPLVPTERPPPHVHPSPPLSHEISAPLTSESVLVPADNPWNAPAHDVTSNAFGPATRTGSSSSDVFGLWGTDTTVSDTVPPFGAFVSPGDDFMLEPTQQRHHQHHQQHLSGPGQQQQLQHALAAQMTSMMMDTTTNNTPTGTPSLKSPPMHPSLPPHMQVPPPLMPMASMMPPPPMMHHHVGPPPHMPAPSPFVPHFSPFASPPHLQPQLQQQQQQQQQKQQQQQQQERR
ncbi:MAG: hypothetical protein MHM6MM_000959 [Cercozoa sp. M6MM]